MKKLIIMGTLLAALIALVVGARVWHDASAGNFSISSAHDAALVMAMTAAGKYAGNPDVSQAEIDRSVGVPIGAIGYRDIKVGADGKVTDPWGTPYRIEHNWNGEEVNV